ncbi:MAG: hypothetical protein LIO96_09895, partial [Lachnospiraceae bacterium]|nr:hypothetical protein [Lachnospiraceae bacterium]
PEVRVIICPKKQIKNTILLRCNSKKAAHTLILLSRVHLKTPTLPLESSAISQSIVIRAFALFIIIDLAAKGKP